jgi:WD40 repeat protein/serine/threonine protein kinase
MDEASIFLEALKRPSPGERAVFLDQACGGNDELRRSVELLLRAHDKAGGFLADSPAPAGVTLDQPAPNSPGTVIGPYKLLEEIGEGGMGTVWMAQQAEPVKRLVAVKLVKAGMDSKQVIARFEAERQALALMDHPNIAKVLDAGTTGVGRPYFVMDLVKGVPITRYCDEHHLTPRQRLELFLPVCQAIQHAHQKGVIHRDLKPSNVLVALYDGRPVPKVIDFGVAKAAGQPLTDKTLVTGFGSIVGTLEYMSPEQAEVNQLDIDTRSDIYSLGVLLYELLAGSTPFTKKDFEKAGMLEMLRVIREQEPSKPSAKLSTAEGLPTLAANRGTEPAKLTKLVRGELDWIVMKALEKDRNRRYETANGFAMDVQRYLADEPVQACPPSAGYRLGKFARRNRGPVLAGSLVLAALVIGIVGTTWGMIRATHAEADAVREAGEKTVALGQKEAALATAKANELEAHKQETLAKEKELLARRRFYASQTNLASQAWEARQPARVLELLEGLRPRPGEEDLRTFEWYYLWRLLHGGRRLALRGHSRIVTGLTYSPDGKALASVSWDGTTRLWDAATGREVSVLEGGAWDVAFSPDGKLLTTGGKETGVVTVWDLASRRVLKRFPQSVIGLAFSPDGKTLAGGGLAFAPDIKTLGGGADDARLWDIATGQERARLAGAGPVAGFSANGKALVTASNWHGGPGTVRLWDPATGVERSRFEVPFIGAIALSPDGATLAVAGGNVGLWDVATGRLRTSIPLDLHPLAFSPDGKSLAGGARDRTVRVIDVATGRELAQEVHLDLVTGAAFSPDGKMLATASQKGHIKTWDMQPAEDAVALPIPDNLGSGRHHITLRFTPDGTTLIVGNAGRTRLVDAATGQEVAAAEPPGVAATSADGNVWAARAAPDRWMIWDRAKGGEKATVPGLKLHPIDVYAKGGALSPDGNTLALWEENHRDNTVTLWDVATRQPRTLRGAPPKSNRLSVNCAAFSPDGKRLAAAFQFQWITVWDLASGRVTVQFRQDPDLAEFGAIGFSPDGTALAASLNNGTVRLWDAGTGQLRATFKGHTGTVSGLAFSPTGETLATCAADGTIRFWDVATGQERLTLKAPHGREACLAFSPDGRTLASFGQDNTLRLWHTAADPEARRGRPLYDDEDCEDPRNLIELGHLLATAGDSAGAEEIARQVERVLAKRSAAATTLSDRTHLAQRWFRLGLLWEQLGRAAEADRAHDRARDFERQLDPADPAAGPTRAFLARWYVAVGNRYLAEGGPLAARAFRRAEELRPDDQQMLRQMARAYLSRGQTEEAAALYDRAIARNPGDAALKARRDQIRPGVIAVWNFDDGPEDWGSPHECAVSASDGVLHIRTAGADPWVLVPVAAPAGWKELTLHVRTDRECQAQLFWATERTPHHAEERSVLFTVKAGKGEWKEVKVRFRADSALTLLRLDPVDGPEGEVRWEVDAATLADVDPPPK